MYLCDICQINEKEKQLKSIVNTFAENIINNTLENNDNNQLPTIGDNVEVGANVVIIGDIEIGNNVVIGAGSVVVKSIPSNCIVAGNPAKVIKQINL